MKPTRLIAGRYADYLRRQNDTGAMNWLRTLLQRRSDEEANFLLWREFVGRGSGPDVAAEKASRLVPVVVAFSRESTVLIAAEIEGALKQRLDEQ